MTSFEIAVGIEHHRFLSTGIGQRTLVHAAGIILSALEEAHDALPRYRFIARTGLRLAIEALRIYRNRWGKDV